jgi:DNA (cytosine-5)-methyltransferase 1
MMTFLDLCSGIGGFRLGLELAGHKCVGYCDNDKAAVRSYRAMYNTEGEWYGDDVTKLKPGDIPRADIWCFGFPCQDVSCANANRRGLAGERSGIYYSIINLVKGKDEEDKPTYLLIENVKNLLHIHDGWDFAEVLAELDEAGYDAIWQVLNSKDFGVPQSRERVFIIANLRSRGRREILPVAGENGNALKQIVAGMQGYRVYDPSGVSATVTNAGGGLDKGAGLYLVRPVIGVNRPGKRQNGRLFKNPDEPMFTLTGQDTHGVATANPDFRIRRLTPKECWRLQGFPDELFEKARTVNPESQLRKQAGNAVTVNVAYAIAKTLPEAHN